MRKEEKLIIRTSGNHGERGVVPSRPGRGRRFGSRAAGLGLGVVLILALLPAVSAQAAPCDPPITNPIACENSKPGNPASEWDVSGGGSSNIEGFATDISVDQGQTVQFKVDTSSSNYRIDIYRVGYYGALSVGTTAIYRPSRSG